MNLAQWLDYQLSIHPVEIDLGLSRVHALAAKLGIQTLPAKIITVAGTNGKGSTVAFLDQLLRGMGIRTGTYTSPHFVSYTERITLSGVAIGEAELCAHFEAIESARGDLALTFFEYGTLAAVRACAQHQVEVMILEIGLGGRLDACNAWDADVSLVTSIGIDHVDWLGDNLEQIGEEKAGVFRADKPAIVGRKMPKRVAEVATKVQAILQPLGVDFDCHQTTKGWDWIGETRTFKSLPLPALRGDFQLDNASCAIQAVLHLYPKLNHTQIGQAMQKVSLTGRLQSADYQGVKVWLDVAHNPHAAQTLARFLQQQAKPTVAVFAMMQDKAIGEVVAIVKPYIDAWKVFDLENERAANKAQLLEIMTDAGVLVETCDNCEAAVIQAIKHRGAQVLVFGSFFTVAAFLEISKNRERNVK